MAAKRVNDAAAYIRSLAQLRGRDSAWAEQAVRESVSLSASDALARKVIDLVAVDLHDLLRQLDGRVVAMGESGAGSAKLATANAAVVTLEPDWRGRLLAVISEPSLVLMLLMIGVYGLLFEFMNPGFVAPGVIGGVALLLALWGLQMLPVNYAGAGADPAGHRLLRRRGLRAELRRAGHRRRRRLRLRRAAADRQRRAGLRHSAGADRAP